MNLEQEIEKVLSNKLEDGTVNKLIGEQFEKGIQNALESLFRSYGDVTKIIEGQLKSVLVPYLESYDYSRYILKLDSILTEVLKNSTSENKDLLENFKELMTVSENEKHIKVTDLFEKWMKYVAEEVDTSDLEVDYDDGVSYRAVEVTFEFEEEEEKRSWMTSSNIYEYATLLFECEQDEEMNLGLRLYRWKDSKDKAWDIEHKSKHDISSLRHLSGLEMMLLKLAQNNTKIIINQESDRDEVQPKKEPEASFS